MDSQPISHKLGRFDMCLDVKDVKKSAEFYHILGFEDVEGNIEEGWLVVAQGNARIGLYQGHVKEPTLNFRGGDVMEISEALREKGIEFEKGPTQNENGASATFKDPDGYVIFLDTHKSEKDILKTMKVQF